MPARDKEETALLMLDLELGATEQKLQALPRPPLSPQLADVPRPAQPWRSQAFGLHVPRTETPRPPVLAQTGAVQQGRAGPASARHSRPSLDKRLQKMAAERQEEAKATAPAATPARPTLCRLFEAVGAGMLVTLGVDLLRCGRRDDYGG